jgi:hypothetical protein
VEKPDVSHLIPLEDRIFAAVAELPQFSKKEVSHYFPNESDRVIYRAIQNMEQQKRIRFTGYASRNKVYTAVGQSRLPSLRSPDGKYVPVSYMLTSAPSNYDAARNWTALEELNRLPIVINRLFFIADIADDKEAKQAYFRLIQQLMELRSRLTTMVGYIDSIVKHPTMAGDINYFREVYRSKDAALPTQEQMNEYKLWFSRNFGQRNN